MYRQRNITSNLFAEGARYNAISLALKAEFGHRMVKLPIDGGFTCPNRDGSKGYGGCLFCSERGSGDTCTSQGESGNLVHYVSGPGTRAVLPIREQMDAQVEIMKGKWKDFRVIAYFQSFTGTYAEVSELRRMYEEALSHPLCSGIAVGTRPDCLSPEILDLLSEINEKTLLWVELGLQTASDESGAFLNRCCTTEDYDSSAANLAARGIRLVTHLILGLPGEDRQQMLDSLDHVCRGPIYGIKLMFLMIMEGTAMKGLYQEGRVKPLTREEYTSIVADCIERIPRNVVLHRLTGDAPGDLLIEPQWSREKINVLNAINAELKRRNSWQGIRCQEAKDLGTGHQNSGGQNYGCQRESE